MARSQEDRSQRGEEGRQGREGQKQSNLQDRSIDELRQMAGDLNIEGRNRLDREQLIEEIERQRGEGGSKGPSPRQSEGGTGYQSSGSEQGERKGGQQQSGRQGGPEEGSRKGGSQGKRP